MRLSFNSFNEIRARAARFAADYADATYEKRETQTLYNDFFQIFGVRRRSVTRYEEHVRNHAQAVERYKLDVIDGGKVD